MTQIGFEDRDGHASEARLRVSVDVEVDKFPTRSAKKIGNGHLVTQIGLEDRDGRVSEARLCVSA